jgi:copper chaperone CopZ
MSVILKQLRGSAVGALLAFVSSCSKEARAEEVPSDDVPALLSVTLAVEGMTCASCSVAVRMALKRLNGVHTVEMSVEKKRAVINYEPAKVMPERMIEAVNRLGYHAAVQGS